MGVPSGEGRSGSMRRFALKLVRKAGKRKLACFHPLQ